MARRRLSRLCALLLAAALVFGAFPARVLAASGAEWETENALLDGQLDARQSDLFACFNGLAAGEEYLVLVSRSGTASSGGSGWGGSRTASRRST